MFMLNPAHSMFVCVAALQPEIHVNACCNAKIDYSCIALECTSKVFHNATQTNIVNQALVALLTNRLYIKTLSWPCASTKN